jgi:hypothetical protein
VGTVSESVAESVAASRPDEELAELRAMLAAAQGAVEAAATASQAAVAGQLSTQAAITEALTEQALQRTTDRATILRAVDDLAAAQGAHQERSSAAHQALTTAQAGLAASTHAEHQALLTASASMVATTHAEHQALLAALDRQKGELAALRNEQAGLHAELAALQQIVPTLATGKHVEWLGSGLTQLGQRLTAQLGEQSPTGPDREQMTAHIANQTADGVGKLLDKREAALVSQIDTQLTALARHVESRIAQLDRRVSAIASMSGDGGTTQSALLERVAALTRQVTDEAIIQNATLERIAGERDETTRLMGQLVADAIAAIQREVRAGAATLIAANGGRQTAPGSTQGDPAASVSHMATTGATPLTVHPAPTRPSAAEPAASPRPHGSRTWTDHLVTMNGIAAPTLNGLAGGEAGAHAPDATSEPTPAADPASRSYPTSASDQTSPRTYPAARPTPLSARTPAGSSTPSTGAPEADVARSTASRSADALPSETTATALPPAAATPPTATPTEAPAQQPGHPSRRRLGHPLKPGDLTQAG